MSIRKETRSADLEEPSAAPTKSVDSLFNGALPRQDALTPIDRGGSR